MKLEFIPSSDKKGDSSSQSDDKRGSHQDIFDNIFNLDEGFLPPPKQQDVEELTESEIIEKFHKVMKITKDIGASDIFMKVGVPPAIRMDGMIQFLKFDELTGRECRIILEKICDKHQMEEFRNEHEVDTAYQVEDIGRFRVNAFLQRGFIGFVMRHVKFEIPTFEQLGLPVDPLIRLAGEHRGLILVTGIAGSGKSTTLASFMEYINQNYNRHIVTIEDPIEFIYMDKRSIIEQREVGMDTRSFATALKHVVRQSPDVILIGEMRDQHTMEAAINAAETGHLVFSTLHSTNAPQTLDRILNFFPPHQHGLIRSQLATILNGVISQRLIKRTDAIGRVPAVEIMTSSPTVRTAIDESRFMDLPKIIEESEYFGMQSFNQSLKNHVEQKKISREDALANADDPDKLLLAFRGVLKGAGAKETLDGAFEATDKEKKRASLREKRQARAKDLLR